MDKNTDCGFEAVFDAMIGGTEGRRREERHSRRSALMAYSVAFAS